MHHKITEAAGLTFIYGSFARPFVNWALESKMDSSWRHYFNALKHLWDMRYEPALRETELGLKRCVKDTTLKYRLLADKLSLLRRLGRIEDGLIAEERKLKLKDRYEQAVKELERIPLAKDLSYSYPPL